MNIGSLRHRISIQKPVKQKDELNQSTLNWVDFKRVWSRMITLKGKEYIAAAATKSENTVRFVVRYTKDIDESMRILYKGRVFEIVAPPINDDEMNRTLTIITSEKR